MISFQHLGYFKLKFLKVIQVLKKHRCVIKQMGGIYPKILALDG